MESIIFLGVYAIVEPILAALYNTHCIGCMSCMVAKPAYVNERAQHMKAWHRAQWFYRGFVLACLLVLLEGFSLLALNLGVITALLMWIVFDPALNLMRGLPFFHQGSNVLDRVANYGFTAFLLKVIALMAAIAVWHSCFLG